MRFPRRLNIRSLLIVVATVAMLLEIAGLGRRSRHYASRSSEAARAEETNRAVAGNLKVATVQWSEEADRIKAQYPAKAEELRAKARQGRRNILFFEGQAERAARARVAYDRAMTHPWEGPPQEVDRLATTTPLDSP